MEAVTKNDSTKNDSPTFISNVFVYDVDDGNDYAIVGANLLIVPLILMMMLMKLVMVLLWC